MTNLDLLADANPVVTDDEWVTTEQGRTLFASIEEATETSSMLPAARPRVSRPWIYVTVGFAVTIAAALPLLLSGGTEPEEVPSDATEFISADSVEGILDDDYVTRTELEMAADATIQCVIDGGGEASWNSAGDGDSIGFTTDPAGSELLAECEHRYLRAVLNIWNRQNHLPAQGFYFYGSVVRCTEARTGNSFGELTQDQLGFMSTVGQRTINQAIAEAPDVYDQCFEDLLSSQPLHYYFVLECVTEATGDEFPNFTDTGSDRLTADQIDILDGARDEFSDEFNHCMGEVTLD